MSLLSHEEVTALSDAGRGGLYKIFRDCSLAVLMGSYESDDMLKIKQQNRHFNIKVIQQQRGVALQLFSAPNNAFVDGKIITGVREQLFAVLRDIVYLRNKIFKPGAVKLNNSDAISNAIFLLLRNANLLIRRAEPNLVVCWGGHAINAEEYNYAKDVGYQIGLRRLNICTGCGAGAMKAHMKGATLAHSKQRVNNSLFVGITEPSIIAAESPNPIVNKLIIMPDIEKRLEAFVRLGHGIIVFPGGVGTAEEILYIIGILLSPENRNIPFPVIFTGPEESRSYFELIHKFIGETLGKQAQSLYKIIVGNPRSVAQTVNEGLTKVKNFRQMHDDAYYYNWSLKVDWELQKPFIPTHKNVASITLRKDMPTYKMAINLRRMFSAIVAGNIKEKAINAIKRKGPFIINADPEIMNKVDKLLKTFAQQKRMKLEDSSYKPCYVLKGTSGSAH